MRVKSVDGKKFHKVSCLVYSIACLFQGMGQRTEFRLVICAFPGCVPVSSKLPCLVKTCQETLGSVIVLASPIARLPFERQISPRCRNFSPLRGYCIIYPRLHRDCRVRGHLLKKQREGKKTWS
ncbi:hypothetical protein BJX68DRAFT_99413 [Aspergillus pseudodeflectus]|uniref:Uncharacterized protein n=1 Tax=Aspergillus pseudodeflectus TaxID=176178 RepID=A0ABR4KCV8_9EURO